MQICITAANCFVGLPLVKKASALGWGVTAVLRVGNVQSDSIASIPNVHVEELNLQDYGRLGQVVGNVDCLVMLTWSGTRGLDRYNDWIQENNYSYCLAGIKSMVEAGCRRVITVGSQAEYGLIYEQITEDSLCQPVTAYGKAKLKLYESSRKFCGDRDTEHLEARIFSVYGPKDYENSLIMSTIKKMKQNRICDLTEGSQLWDYLYIDDAANGLICLCEKGKSGIYNLASGDCRPLKEFIIEMKQILNSTSDIHFGAIPYGKEGPVSINPSVEKLKGLGWSPKVPFAEGIKRLNDSLIKG